MGWMIEPVSHTTGATRAHSRLLCPAPRDASVRPAHKAAGFSDGVRRYIVSSQAPGLGDRGGSSYPNLISLNLKEISIYHLLALPAVQLYSNRPEPWCWVLNSWAPYRRYPGSCIAGHHQPRPTSSPTAKTTKSNLDGFTSRPPQSTHDCWRLCESTLLVWSCPVLSCSLSEYAPYSQVLGLSSTLPMLLMPTSPSWLRIAQVQLTGTARP